MKHIQPFRFIAYTMLFVLLNACSPIAYFVLPTSSLATGVYYQQKYLSYDENYRNAYTFIEHKVPRNNHRLYAREYGKQHQSENNSTLILMHGFPDSLHLYDDLAPILAENRHVVSFDFLGWGQSDKPAFHTYNVQSLYDDLDSIVQYFQLNQVELVVHDASGPPGIDWALDHPEQVASLVLLNTYYHPMEELIAPEAIQLFSRPSLRRSVVRTGALISHYGWSRGFSNQVAKFFYDENQRGKFLPVFVYQALSIKSAFFEHNELLVPEYEARQNKLEWLRQFPKPVKIVFGQEDPYLNIKVAKQFHQTFPNSTLHLIEQAAHYVQLDNAEHVAAAILDDFITEKLLADQQGKLTAKTTR